MSNDMRVMWAEDADKMRLKRIEENVRRRVEETFKKIEESPELSFRKGQYDMALEVTDAIFKKHVLLEEAGVGIGKSFGYLIPVLIYIDECKKYGIDYRKKAVLVTSSKELQHQLQDKDIVKLKELLGISGINVQVAKGLRNYVCQRQVERTIDSNIPSHKQRSELMRMYQDADFSDEIDRTQYNLNSKIWKEISGARSFGCNGCNYVAKCLLPSRLKEYQTADVLITNPGDLLNRYRNNDSAILNADLFVFDEAHNVSSQIRDNTTETFRIDNLHNSINRIVSFVILRYYHREEGIENYNEGTIKLLNDFFNILKRNASDYYRKHDKTGGSFVECEETGFNSKLFSDSKFISYSSLIRLYDRIGDLLNRVAKCKSRLGRGYSDMEKDIERLCKFYDCLKDLKGRQEHIYSVKVLKHKGAARVELLSTPKSIGNIIGEIIKGKPTIFTSATMTSNTPDDCDNRGYEAFKTKLGLQNKTGIVESVPKESPFNYAENCLLYYDTTLPSATDKKVPHDEYIKQLAQKVDNLITATNGRTLVLFTNKIDMLKTYKYLITHGNHNFNVLLHDNSSKSTIEKFRQDINSVLLSASAWEGLDIPGESLSHVIITKLPFPTPSSVIDYFSEGLTSKQAFNNVIYPEMISKLLQGFGRLIRNENDTGILSICDPRFLSHSDSITAILPTNLQTTNDFRVAKKFVKAKILKKSS